MLSILFIVLGAIAAYLIGSFPTAVWLGEGYYGIDVRHYGSGNAGATNTFRVLGKKAGTIVMLLDITKGFTAAQLASILALMGWVNADFLTFYKLIFGILAIVGHIFPIYTNFKGGKGVATLLGMALAIEPEVALVCIGIFFVVLLASRYVSLGSMIAALAFPLLLLLPRFSPDTPLLIIFGFALFAVVVLTHQKNIRRLIHGEENKTYLLRNRRNRDH
ncbi:glycerol-3-phosphate 1-O-acyltransferase PlsY [Catalinimonas alkaloidigena]|uniref:glycerol-3-phosphate 1-O-acyltransferase PlsY n=1 Tax=Catalinimonas alkaloidigena TaxID=1075417 RepID=UPI000B7CB57D|nr:glycerol-3-phosphate 1-O-acyltransferase PlsY [Catalinimonas alkaloidigena]